MLVTHAIKKSLTVCRIIDYFHCQIFLTHLGECLGNLIHICFVHCFVAFAGIWSGNLRFAVEYRDSFCCQSIAGTQFVDLGYGSDIACMKFRNLDRFGSFHDIQLADLQFFFSFYII